MAKKKNEQNFISDLLGKLKASYSDTENKPEPKKGASKSSTGDEDFQKQLEAMLNKSTVASAPPQEEPSKPMHKTEEKAPKAVKASPSKAQKETGTKKVALAKPKKKKATPTSNTEEPVVDLPSLAEEPIAPSAEEVITVSAPVELPEELIEDISEDIPEGIPQQLPVKDQAPCQEAQEKILEADPIEEAPIEEIIIPETQEVKDILSTPPKDETSAPIVIRPKQTNITKQKTIVIQPRNREKAVITPKPIQQEASNEPIRIGKKVVKKVVKVAAPSKKPHAVSEKSEKGTANHAVITPSTQTVEKKKRVVTVSAMPKKEPVAPAVKAVPTVEMKVTETPPVAPAPQKAQEVPATAPIKEAIAPTPPEPSAPIQTAPSEKKDESLSFTEQIYQRTGLSEDDVDLLFALGYEGELANLVGDDALKELKSTHLRKKGKREKKPYPTAFGYRGKEYVGKEDQSSVLAAYVHDRTHLIVRLILSALCSLCLLFVENPSLRGSYGQTLVQSAPWAFPVFGILLLLASAALSFAAISEGIKSFFQFMPSPYSVCGILLVPTLIYDITALFDHNLTLHVNFLVSLAILITVICDVLRFCGEMRVFRLLSTKGEKNVLESTTLRKKKVKQGEKVVKILNDEVGESFYRISKAKDTSGFFRRCNTMLNASRAFTALILVSLGLALALAFATAIKTRSLSAAILAFILFLIIGAPISSVIGFFYSLFHTNRILTHHQCALIGEESVEEYCQNKTVIFEDGEMFHTEKCTEIALDESDDFQNDMKLASALFRKIGNTLDPIGHAAVSADNNAQVTLTRISENGVEATIKSHRIMAGDATFFKKNAIRVPKESSDRVLRRTKNVRVMYVAIDGAIKLHYEIEYTEKLSFEAMANALSQSNTAVAIRSYDPNLNDSFVHEICHDQLEKIHVIKPGRYEENCVLDLVDTGAVSLDAPEKTVCALHAAAKINKTRSFTTRMQLIATLLGGVGAFFAILFGGFSIGVWHIALYHLFWIAVSLVATHLEITEDKLHLFK